MANMSDAYGHLAQWNYDASGRVTSTAVWPNYPQGFADDVCNLGREQRPHQHYRRTRLRDEDGLRR